MKLADIATIVVESKDEDKSADQAPAPGKLGEFITTAQAAKILGVSMSRVRQFISEDRLKSYSPEAGRRDNMLKLAEVEAFAEKERKRTGRPEGAKEGDKKED